VRQDTSVAAALVLPSCYLTTVLICASPDLEGDLSHTLFWRDDLERYVAERAEEARMLALVTEPHAVVVERDLPGAQQLISALKTASLPHPVSIVALRRVAVEIPDEELSSTVDVVLSLPPGPEWDNCLDKVLELPTRKQERFEVHFDVETVHPRSAYMGLALNMSAGGLLIECPGGRLYPGDDVSVSLPLPDQELKPVEGRARVVRQPVDERLGLRFEAFTGNGDARVRDFLAVLAAQHRSASTGGHA
jgi:PilZ domain